MQLGIDVRVRRLSGAILENFRRLFSLGKTCQMVAFLASLTQNVCPPEELHTFRRLTCIPGQYKDWLCPVQNCKQIRKVEKEENGANKSPFRLRE